MKRPIPLFFLLILAAATLWTGCEDSGTDTKDLTFPESNVSYSQHVQPYFNLYCATSGCHNGQSSATTVTLTSHFQTTANPGVVVPGDPNASLLVQKINVGGWEGAFLPHDVSVPIIITENQYYGIRTWIEEGALNN